MAAAVKALARRSFVFLCFFPSCMPRTASTSFYGTGKYGHLAVTSHAKHAPAKPCRHLLNSNPVFAQVIKCGFLIRTHQTARQDMLYTKPHR